LEAITHGSAASRIGGLVAMRGSVQAFVDDTAEFIGKDVDVVRRTAAELGTRLGVLDDAIEAVTRP
jgi:hypothetical protein